MRKVAPVFILSLIWICWAIPLAERGMSPHFFEGAKFQWPYFAIMAVLVPIAILLGLRLLFSERRRTGLLIILIAGIPWAVQTTYFGYFGSTLKHTNWMNDQTSEIDIHIIKKLTSHAQDLKSVGKREMAVTELYREFGIIGTWKDQNGNLVVYVPDEEGVKKHQASLKTMDEIKSEMGKLGPFGNEISALFLLHFGSFVIIMTAGLVYFAFRKDKRLPEIR